MEQAAKGTVAIVTLVVLSPHLDDAVLCASGYMRLARAMGAGVTILTVFAGHPPSVDNALAQEFHDECGLGDDAVTVRRAEDEAAAALLGVRTCWLDLPDAIYRFRAGVPIYDSRDSLFQDPSSEDCALCRRAENLILERVPDIEAILVPLSVGGHVDHVLTRRIGEAVVATACPQAVGWYEESLYEGQMGAAAWTGVDTTGLTPSQLTLPSDLFALKARAVETYQSQIEMLGAGPQNAAERVGFFDRLRIERVWFATGAGLAGLFGRDRLTTYAK